MESIGIEKEFLQCIDKSCNLGGMIGAGSEAEACSITKVRSGRKKSGVNPLLTMKGLFL